MIPEDDGIGCYIQQKGCGTICHCIGVPKDKRKDLDWMIDANFENWAINYTKDIKRLEKAREE